MNKLKNKPVGIFDSGIGGLTVLKEVKKILPNESFIYLADLKNNPYGIKSREELIKITKNILDFFVKKEVKAIIIACNTAASVYIQEMKKDYNIPIFTILESAVNGLDVNYKKILLAATNATCSAGVYDDLLYKKDKNIKLYKIPCHDLVEKIELNIIDKKSRQNFVDKYIESYKDKNIDVLLLGCTHYPIWEDEFKKSIGNDTNVINPAFYLANDFKKYLEKNDMLREDIPNSKYYVTKNLEKFFINAKNIIEKIYIEDIEEIEID